MRGKINFLEYISGIFLFLVAFVSIINIFAGIIGGVWLLFEGLIFEVVAGFLYGVFGHYILGIVMMLPLIFGAPAALLFEKRKYVLGSIFLLLNQLVTVAITYFSVMYVFGAVAQLSDIANFIPVLLFAYATSFAPWAFLANEDKKSGNQNASLVIMSGQIGFILGIFIMLISGQGAWVSILFLVGLISGTILNLIPAVAEIKSKRFEYSHEQ